MVGHPLSDLDLYFVHVFQLGQVQNKRFAVLGIPASYLSTVLNWIVLQFQREKVWREQIQIRKFSDLVVAQVKVLEGGELAQVADSGQFVPGKSQE